MAAGENRRANQTSVQREEYATALWGAVSPEGLCCFRRTLPELLKREDCLDDYAMLHGYRPSSLIVRPRVGGRACVAAKSGVHCAGLTARIPNR